MTEQENAFELAKEDKSLVFPADYFNAGWQAALSQPALDGCEWTLDDDENGIWLSGCGQTWSFIDGGPTDNGMKFCHCCGKPMVIAAPAGAQDNKEG